MPAKKKITKKPEVAAKEEPQELTPDEVHPEAPRQSSAPRESLDEETKLTRVNRVWFAVGGVVTVGVVAATIVIAILYLKNPVVVTNTVQKTVVTSPTPTPAFSRTAITLEVLNGSGTSGAAGRAATKLRDLGYTVVSTGNALEKTKTSQLFLVTSAKHFESQIIADLFPLFAVSSQSGDLTDSTASARLIIGTSQ